ncbi:MAG: right-handed parallel beta-helix repeat-containing protein [Acidobacteriota bacterium]
MIRKHILVLVCGLGLVTGSVQAATIYVGIDTCPGTGSGTQLDPYCSIQTAIDGALPGDTVNVAEGTYTEKHTRSLLTVGVPVFPNPATALVFMRDQVHLEGAGAGKTILDAGGSDRVVIFDQVGPGTRFEGFTVTGGDLSSRVGDGGGLLVMFSSPTISRNHIVGNHAFFGGGVEVIYSSPVIEENLVELNTAVNSAGTSTGGGIDVAFLSNPLITRNRIVGNFVTGLGGGMSFYETNAQVDSNRIEGNVAEGNGGGVFSAPSANQTRGSVKLRSNVISMNVALVGAVSELRHGGGVFATEDTDLILNTISHNRSESGDGGGVYTFGPQISLSENLIFRNGAVAGGGVFIDPSSNPQISGNDVHANLPGDFGGAADPSGSQGNFSADPLLANVPDFVTTVLIDRFQNLVMALDEEPQRQFAVGDIIEYGNDEIPRVVTEIKTAPSVPLIKLVTDPLVTPEEMLSFSVVLRRWGANDRTREDFDIGLLSPLTDVGGTNSLPAVDALGRVRKFDGDLNGLDRVDVGAVENLAELSRLDIAADGTLSWETFAGLPWHVHLYRAVVSGLADANADGVPDGPDGIGGTPDDGYGTCLVPGVDLFGPDYLDLDVPALGEAFFYLATVADAGEGALGFDSAERLRVNLQPCD